MDKNYTSKKSNSTTKKHNKNMEDNVKIIENEIVIREDDETSKVKEAKTVNLLDFAEAEVSAPPIGIVKLGSDETAVIAFTLDVETSAVHYCEESEIKGYIHCNGPGCVLCKIGKRKVTKIFLPVYLPTIDKIGILPLNKSMTPAALLPKIIKISKAEMTMVMFITRESYTYNVSSQVLADDSGGDMSVIEKFKDEYQAGNYDLKSVYPKIDNDELASIEEISVMLKLKGGV